MTTDTNTDRLKRAESAAIMTGKDKLLGSFAVVKLVLIPALIDLIHVVRDHEQQLRGEQKGINKKMPR